MKEPKKLECKNCKSDKNLHEHTHPAGWTYVLCGECTSMKNASIGREMLERHNALGARIQLG